MFDKAIKILRKLDYIQLSEAETNQLLASATLYLFQKSCKDWVNFFIGQTMNYTELAKAIVQNNTLEDVAAVLSEIDGVSDCDSKLASIVPILLVLGVCSGIGFLCCFKACCCSEEDLRAEAQQHARGPSLSV